MTTPLFRDKDYEEIPFSHRVACGKYKPHYLSQNKFAENPSLGTTEEDIWNQGGIKSYLSTAETMNIASTDGNDKGVATALSGARTVKIFGLDANYDLIDETVTLNGTNDVETVNSYIRIYRMRVITAGSTGSNEGAITATASSAGTVQGNMAIGDNSTLMSHYTVPNGYYLILSDIEIGVQKNDQVEIGLWARPENGVFSLRRQWNLFQQTIEFSIDPPIVYAEKTDIVFRGTDLGAGSVSVSVNYGFYLVKEENVNI